MVGSRGDNPMLIKGCLTSPFFKKTAAFMDSVVAPEVELVACPLDIVLLLMSIVRVKLLLYLFKNCVASFSELFFFTDVVFLLGAMLYHGIHDGNHKYWNIVSIEKYTPDAGAAGKPRYQSK
jgi:hypothetical protein